VKVTLVGAGSFPVLGPKEKIVICKQGEETEVDDVAFGKLKPNVQKMFEVGAAKKAGSKKENGTKADSKDKN
jgi:hypothetical protein